MEDISTSCIKLTDADGHPIWIFKSWVQAVRLPRPNEFYSPHIRAVVVLSGINQAVRESIEEVITRLDGYNIDAKE